MVSGLRSDLAGGEPDRQSDEDDGKMQIEKIPRIVKRTCRIDDPVKFEELIRNEQKR